MAESPEACLDIAQGALDCATGAPPRVVLWCLSTAAITLFDLRRLREANRAHRARKGPSTRPLPTDASPTLL